MGVLAAFISGGGGLGVLSAIFNSTSTVFYRLAIPLWPHGRSAFVVIANWIGAVSAFVLLYWYHDWLAQIHWTTILVFICLSSSLYYNGSTSMKLNKTEKLSTLQIFGNITTILTIIVGFFLYGKTSVATLCIAILCGLILFGTQFFGSGKFHPPKAWKEILSFYLLASINSLVIVWLIGEIGSLGYFIISSWFSTGTALVVLFISRTAHEIFLGTKKIYLYRGCDGVLFNATRFLNFFLIGSLGPVVSTLLGMIGNITTLIF